MNTASAMGISCGDPLARETKVGIVPPRAKPMFHDNPVPLARSAVGKRSLRKITMGAIAGIAEDGDRQGIGEDGAEIRRRRHAYVKQRQQQH